MPRIDSLMALDDHLKRVEFRKNLAEHMDGFVRGMALSMATLLETLGLIDVEDLDRVSNSIYALTYNYTNLKEIVHTVTSTTDPQSESYKVMQRWKDLPDDEKKKGLDYELAITPSHRDSLVEEFKRGVEVIKPFPAFSAELACMTAAVESSNYTYKSMLEAIDVTVFEQAAERAVDLHKAIDEVFVDFFDAKKKTKESK